MHRRDFFSALSALAIASCARDGKRAPRYDTHACPFCTTKKGTCTYCNGTKQCTFCKGTRTRTIVIPDLPEQEIKASRYEEPCPFCGGKGTGVCRACKGSGRIESWNFY